MRDVEKIFATLDPERRDKLGEGIGLEVEGLCLRMGGKSLVSEVSFALPLPDFTIIMGPNGAGKSLLLRLLHGLIEPSAGRVRWDGQMAGPAHRRKQAMVFQKPVLLRRSVAANLDYVLKSQSGKNRAERQRQRQELLRLVGLLGHEAQPARLLSGGEQQRLALARALALEPEVLYLDEPTANLDPASAAMIETILLHQRGLGTRVVMVTHDIGQAQRLADDVLFMHRGRIVEQARANRFFNGPASSAARTFLAGQIVL